jgi:hypothetical protein
MFGSPVKIIRGIQKDERGSWVKVQYEDGTKREVLVGELRADDGIKEILDAADEVK